MAEPGDLDSAFMSAFTEANVSAAESAHAASSGAREGPVAKQRETAAKAEARKAAKMKPAVTKTPLQPRPHQWRLTTERLRSGSLSASPAIGRYGLT